jgi:tetratricopeptide (TPR) repeat protein
VESKRRDPYYELQHRARKASEGEEWQLALADNEAAIKLKPTEGASYRSRAETYRSKKDWIRALEDHAEDLRLEVDKSSAYFSRGETFKAKGDWSAALEDHTLAIALRPRDGYRYRLAHAFSPRRVIGIGLLVTLL